MQTTNQDLTHNYNYAIKQATHCITVRSLVKRYPDTKSFSIHCQDQEVSALRDILQRTIEQAKNHGALQQKIVFETEKNDNNQATHQISITTKNHEENTMRSFRIRTPDHSSTEVADVLKIKLTGEEINE